MYPFLYAYFIEDIWLFDRMTWGISDNSGHSDDMTKFILEFYNNFMKVNEDQDTEIFFKFSISVYCLFKEMYPELF